MRSYSFDDVEGAVTDGAGFTFFARKAMVHTFYYFDGSVGQCENEAVLCLRRECKGSFLGPVVEVVE